jgi:hypothetical protein
MSTTTSRALRILAGATILAAGLALSGCSILNTITGGVQRDDDGNVTQGNDNADVFSIAVGDCLNDADVSGEVQTVPIVSCDEPHDSEAYYSYIVADGAFPGDDAIADEAGFACVSAFDTFVGVLYEDSELDATYYSPTAESWSNGDREILCIIYDPAGPVTGSLEGAQR